MQPKPPLSLFDLLHLLSLDGFEANIWSRLPHQARASFRRTCRQGRDLVDSLVTSVSLSRQGVLRQSIATHVALLSRLPRLNSLAFLSGWPDEVQLVGALPQYGDASAGRVTRLALCEEQLSHAGALAIDRAFPALTELDLTDPQASFGFGSTMKLNGALFLPLHGGQLAKLSMTSCNISHHALASVAGLTALRHLHAAHLYATYPAQLRPLSSLRSLRHCDITTSDPASLADASALFYATGLTLLRISKVCSTPDADQRFPAPITAALALLGGLACLQSLDLGPSYVVDGPALSALNCLPQLTRLCVARIAAAAPTPGHLPRLQALRVGDVGERLDVCHLLHTLLPLLPLPALATLGDGDLTLEMRVEPGGDNFDDDDDEVAAAVAAVAARVAVDAQAAALKSIMPHLAAAPRLGSNLRFAVSIKGTGPYPSLDRIVDSLQPLGAGLRTLAIWGYVELGGADWHRVHERLPGLTELRLDGQHSSGWDVPAMVRHLPGVARLELYLSRGDAEDRAMWLRLAQECNRRVEMVVDLPEETVALCEAVQERVHGERLMTW